MIEKDIEEMLERGTVELVRYYELCVYNQWSPTYDSRDAVQSGSVPERDDSGEDRDTKHRDDPTASPDPPKGPDESPKDEAAHRQQGKPTMTVFEQLGRIMSRVQARQIQCFGDPGQVENVFMSQVDHRKLFREEGRDVRRDSIQICCGTSSVILKWAPNICPGQVLVSFFARMMLDGSDTPNVMAEKFFQANGRWPDEDDVETHKT